MTDWRTYPFLYPIMIRYLRVRNLIVWDYGWIKAGNFYRPTYELIIFATNGDSKRTFSRGEADVWCGIRCVNYTLSNRRHQAEKPVGLMEKMILNSSKEDDTVLDPFMGSGTTGVACVETGRKFIGFEKEQNFFEISQKRIAEAQAKKMQDLF